MSLLQPRSLKKTLRHPFQFRPFLEVLERRIVFASDFGDAPLPYKTLLSEGGAEHVAIGPTLGGIRDTEADGFHSIDADGDDNTGFPDDESGVSFGTMRVGQLGASANVSVGSGPAILSAWIDFNQDGSWGGPMEKIASDVIVHTGLNTVTFDIPSWTLDGTTYARFRLSSTSGLGPSGAASDGEVEDHIAWVQPPKIAAGSFGQTKFIAGPSDHVFDLVAADLDSDGDMDVVSSVGKQGIMTWFENDGSESFTSHTISGSTNALSVHTADLDGDGDFDLLAGTFEGARWFENDGNQNFASHAIITGSYQVKDVLAADVDGDGDLDVVAGFYTSNKKVTWFENDGAQNFMAHTFNALPSGVSGVDIGDLDRDGDLDLVASIKHTIFVLRNNGQGNFSILEIGGVIGARSVSVTDLDADLDADVLFVGFNSDQIVWCENIGSTTFIAHVISATADGAQSAHATDVDGDGDTDVVAALFLENRFVWYENDGLQNFEERSISDSTNSVGSISVADLDGDADLDAVAGFGNLYANKTIAWYENLRVRRTDANLTTEDDTPLPIPPPPVPETETISVATRILHNANTGIDKVAFSKTADELPTTRRPSPRLAAIKRLAVAISDSARPGLGNQSDDGILT